MRMQRPFLLTFLLLLGAWAGGAAAGPRDKRVGILIIDAPVDSTHPDLAPFFDREAMRRLTLPDENGQAVTWDEHNVRFKRDYEKLMNPDLFDQQAAISNAFGALQSPQLSRGERLKQIPVLLRGALPYLLSRSWRENLGLLQLFLHGTHVAGVATRGLDPANAKLLSYPWEVADPANLSASAIDTLLGNLRREFAALSRSLREENVRVVVLCQGTSTPGIWEMVRELSKLTDRIFRRGELQYMNRKIAEGYRSELERFFRETPGTAFVLAAGNGNVDLSRNGKADSHWGSIEGDNVVVVGAMNTTGGRLRGSNYGRQTVDLFAPGNYVESARAGGGRYFMAETSVAAPAVGNRLMRIFSENPEMETKQAIATLLKEETLHSPALSLSAIGGRYLRPESTSRRCRLETLTHSGALPSGN